jgi:hypothetical protein
VARSAAATKRLAAAKPAKPARQVKQAKQAKPKTAAEATRAFKRGLTTLPDVYVECRDITHRWTLDQDFHVVPYTWEGREVQVSRRVWSCVCTSVRTQLFLNGRYGLEKIQDNTVRPKDYSVRGVPRGVKVKAVTQQESYRRALERAAGALPGERASAER